MASVVANYDLNVNFWKSNPQFKSLGAFADLYKNDQSRGKKDSSIVMWAVTLYTDSDKDNKFRNFSDKEKKELIKKEILGKVSFSWNKNQHLIDLYAETQLTQKKRSLIMLRRKMVEREEFLSKSKYTIENAKELDSIIANTDKLFNLLSKLEEQIEKENETEGGQVRGGRTESASERKEI